MLFLLADVYAIILGRKRSAADYIRSLYAVRKYYVFRTAQLRTANTLRTSLFVYNVYVCLYIIYALQTRTGVLSRKHLVDNFWNEQRTHARVPTKTSHEYKLCIHTHDP